MENKDSRFRFRAFIFSAVDFNEQTLTHGSSIEELKDNHRVKFILRRRKLIPMWHDTWEHKCGFLGGIPPGADFILN